MRASVYLFIASGGGFQSGRIICSLQSVHRMSFVYCRPILIITRPTPNIVINTWRSMVVLACSGRVRDALRYNLASLRLQSRVIVFVRVCHGGVCSLCVLLSLCNATTVCCDVLTDGQSAAGLISANLLPYIVRSCGTILSIHCCFF